MLRVKICGLTTPEDAAAAIEFGADALGVNFFPGSKRYVRRELAAGWIGTLPGNIEKLAILVNPTWEEAVAAAVTEGITALQLHGAETPEFCRRLLTEGVRFEKAIPVTGADSLASVPDFFTRPLLLDSAGSAKFCGRWQAFPWEFGRSFA